MNEIARIQPTRDTANEIKRWGRSMQGLESAKRALNSAECELLNATNHLGRFMSPPDAKVGEVFNIWFGDGLLAVEKIDDNGNGDYRVSWRKRPSKLP